MDADIDEMQRKTPSHSLPSQERIFGLPADDDMQQEYGRSRNANGSEQVWMYTPGEDRMCSDASAGVPKCDLQQPILLLLL